jgi:hypothetical protein
MKIYNQYEAVTKALRILEQNGFEVSRIAKPGIEANLIIKENSKQFNILVRHLEKDHAYKNSPLPYKIYKIEAFDDNEERDLALKTINYVLGYNFNDDCFACIPIEEYKNKRSVVVHEKEGTRHEYFKSLHVLTEHLA